MIALFEDLKAALAAPPRPTHWNLSTDSTAASIAADLHFLTPERRDWPQPTATDEPALTLKDQDL